MTRLSRRDLLRGAGVALSSAALGVQCARSRPNIVVLLDDLGYGQFGPNRDMFDAVRELKADYAQWFRGTKKPLAWEEQYWKILAP